MKQNLLALTLATTCLFPVTSFAQTAAPAAEAPAPAAAPANPFTGNVTLASEYLYRGIAQTRGKPAIQGGFDYAHPSGFYIGTWGSSISWLNDAGAIGAGLEIDVYGGYKGTVSGDLTYDVGVLTYNYPGTYPAALFAAKPDTTEVYGALTWKWLTAKYSVTTGNLFGQKNPTTGKKSDGSGYFDLTATYDLGGGWGVNGHAGHQTVKDFTAASYSDWKLGVTKDIGIGVIGLSALGTNAKDSCSAGEWYCFLSVANPTAAGYSSGKNRALLTFTKTL